MLISLLPAVPVVVTAIEFTVPLAVPELSNWKDNNCWLVAAVLILAAAVVPLSDMAMAGVPEDWKLKVVPVILALGVTPVIVTFEEMKVGVIDVVAPVTPLATSASRK